jgi:hypothetical protein
MPKKGIAFAFGSTHEASRGNIKETHSIVGFRMELRVEEDTPSLVVGMDNVHQLAIPKHGAPFVCPLKNRTL